MPKIGGILMAMFTSKVTTNEISELIESEDFNQFHLSIKRELDIEDMYYQLVTAGFARNEGYVNENTNARTKFNDSWQSVEKITLFTEGLSESINTKFGRISGKAFTRVVELFVKYALVHELVHVRQFKVGELTKQKKDDMSPIPYEERDLEIEANLYATETMGRTGGFDNRIIGLIAPTSESIDNENLYQILNLF